MQQKLSSRPCGSFGAGLSLSCSQCGGRERSGTPTSLLTRAEHRRIPRPPDAPLPEPGRGAQWRCGSLPGPRWGEQSVLLGRRRTRSVGLGAQDKEEEEEDGQEEEEEEEDEEVGDAVKKEEGLSQILFLNRLSSPHPPRPPPDPGPDPDPRPPPGSGSDPGGPGPSVELEGRDGRSDYWRFSGLEAAVRGRLAVLLRAADSSMQRRLARVSWELAQTDTALLCEHAHRQHLARERQRAAERQRSLSRQVDGVVMVIAALREQLSASEDRLEQREREALSIQSFLAAAVRQETSGRVRVQRFIETLLERIALAERLVQLYQEEYYQRDRPPTRTHTQQLTEHTPHRMSKSRSAGGQPYSGLYDNRSPTSSSSSRPSLDQDQDQEWVWEPRQRCRSLGYEV